VLGIAIVVIAALSTSRDLQAQQTGDLSQQLQLFNNLSPDQQQQLLQRFGMGDQGGSLTGLGGMGSTGGLSGLGSSPLGGTGLGGLGSNSSQSVLQQQLLLQQQRRSHDRQQLDANEFRYGYYAPVFKPGDSVLVEIKLLPESDRTGQQNDQSQNQSQTTLSPNPNGAVYSNLAGGQQSFGQSSLQRVQEQPQRTTEELRAEERRQIEDMIGHIKLHNPYEVDQNGELNLPGVPAFRIAGLTEDQATRLVNANLAFEKTSISLLRLPVDKSGEQALKPFGYDLFENSTIGLLPMLNMPVPSDYIVGPGDTVQIQLFGTTNQMLRLPVQRNGEINFPQLGPIQVAGQRFSAMQSDLEDRVNRQIIGTHASVSMGEVRTVNVFVTGGAAYPGSYTVSSLATVTTALFAAGGVKKKGSLRAIEVRRQGVTIRQFDLYDLLMRGDSTNDITLESGDVVFIPPIGPTASADGEVQRPGIYEVRGEQSVADLIQMAGGLTPEADAARAALIRIQPDQQRVVVEINPRAPATTGLAVRNGDLLQVAHLRPQLDSGITVHGAVYRQRYIAWHEGMRLSEALPSAEDLRPNADQHYILIQREAAQTRNITLLSADLAAALAAPRSAADTVLMPRDTLTIFDLETSRQWIIASMLNEIRLQSSLGEPTRIVHVDGQVKVPGDYPLEPGMRISDLLRAGGGLSPDAYGNQAELARYTVEGGSERQTQVINVDLVAMRSGDSSADVLLQPFDRLSIKQITDWTEQDQIQLRGEVRFPGVYAIRPGETLKSVVERAGGLTPYAFPEGSLFTRLELKAREQEQLDHLSIRLRTEIAEVALMGVRAQQGAAPSAITVGESLLRQISDAKAVGRLVIDLRASLANKVGSSDDIILRNGDQLIVPKQRQEVMVLGEVQDPTAHLYRREMRRDDYVYQSGGPTRQADHKRIYVVRANGSVETGDRGWFHNSDSVVIHPGDTIIVPLDTERLPALTLYTAVSTILYNIAIAAATVHGI
jgi:protein involved in polysaccharide export with SLBB domain